MLYRLKNHSGWQALTLLACIAGVSPEAQAAGILGDGQSARAHAIGGASVAASSSPLDALATNPAAMVNSPRTEVEATVEAPFAHASFQNRVNDHAEINESGVKGKFAISHPWGPVRFGISFAPESALRADWTFRDAPGGLDGLTSYGERTHRSELTLLRLAFGAAYQVTKEFSLGASLGVLYNRNQLHAPYTLQSQPQLAGAKVLLDLDTEGWGVNAVFGATWKPMENLEIGASYTLASRIRAEGRAHADAGRQLRNLGLTDVDATSDFDAEVTNTFPQILSLGVAWKPMPKLTTIAQLDWINWEAAFEVLDVRLRNSDNELYRELLNQKRNLDDDAPLRWHDQWVIRAGLEYAVTPQWTLRAGYRYARSPVPAETLTPLTAAIGEHIVSAGLGYANERVAVDLAWQWQLPATMHTGNSILRNGEYSQSRVTLESHTLSLTTRLSF